jgi:hypothetical protein
LKDSSERAKAHAKLCNFTSVANSFHICLFVCNFKALARVVGKQAKLAEMKKRETIEAYVKGRANRGETKKTHTQNFLWDLFFLFIFHNCEFPYRFSNKRNFPHACQQLPQNNKRRHHHSEQERESATYLKSCK